MQITYQEEGYQEVLVGSYWELMQVVTEHQGRSHDEFSKSVAPDIIGTIMCNDGTRILFRAPDAEAAERILDYPDIKEPVLREIVNGWSAHGDGWAVHGATREEVIANYWEAAKRRQEILAMPPYYEQQKQAEEREG